MMKNSKTKRILSAVLSVAMLLTVLTSMWVYSASADTASSQPAATAAEPADADLNGKGTEAEPFRIGSKEDLEKMRDHVNAQDRFFLDAGVEAYANAYYELTADIELDDSTNWNPIGRGSNGISSTYTFSGSFDGKGHTISGLYFKANSNYYTFGLFGYNSGTIKNLFVKDCNVTGYFWNGVIAGINYGTIENCLTSGTIDGAFNNGGITGINRGGTIKNCLSVATASHDSTDGIYGSSYDRTESSGAVSAVIENNYYIDSVAGINVPGKVEPVSQADLASGKVAWLLQNGVDGDDLVWEQNLNSDELPQLHKTDDGDRSNAVHQVIFYFYNTDTVIANLYVNENTITAPGATVDIDGYTVGDKWFTDKDKVDGDEDAWDFASDKVTKDTVFYSSKKAIEYTITYNLGENGSWGDKAADETGHPSKYTVEDRVEILDEPVREDGYKFIGWTGTGITGSAQKEVTIETGSTGNKEYTAQYYDSENPVATITVGEDSWKYPATAIEFDTFFNTSQAVTITAEDNDDPNVDIWYYIANAPVDDIESINWIPYNSENKPVIDPEGKYVIYAKAADNENNIGYTNTSGIVLEVTAPVISGINNGAAYCESVTFTVEDANLAAVTANGNVLTAAEDGTYTINTNDTYTVTATDKAGNKTVVNITVAAHVPGEPQIEIVSNVTCETDGEKLISIYCTNCYQLISRNSETILHEGHKWDEGRTITSASCDSAGDKQYTCTVCSAIRTDVINPLGHAWEEEKSVIREATCQQDGLKAKHCQRCDATSEEENIPALPHNIELSAVIAEVKATCTADGYIDTEYRCSMCQETQKVVRETLASPGHQWGAWETKETPNCVDSGYLEHECSVCHIIETQNVAPNGHTWATEPDVDQEATCTVDGSRSIHCTVCGVSKPDSSEVIKAEGHKPADAKLIVDSTPATCESNGGHYEVTVCSVCNEEISRTFVVDYSTGHNWGDWYFFTSDVCGGDTGERRDCKACQATETRNINKLAHAWNVDEEGQYVYTEDLAPTCTTQGSESVHCTRSGCVAILDSRTIEAKGHDWSDWTVIESPDCEDSGTKMRTCQRCKTTETEGINPNGHTWNVDSNGEYVYTVDAAASCTTDGSESVHCLYCDAKINSRPIPAHGHTFGDWTITNSPDCEDEGTMQRKCSECGYTESENIAATGHVWETDEDGNEVYTVDLEPSCTTDGSKSIHCTKCDAKKDSTSIPMVDHTWGPWVTVEMPDCDDEGTQQRTCQVCGAIDTLGLDPTGHEWPVDENGETVYTIVEATCTTDGSKSVLCARCGVALESEVIPALGHDFVDGICTRCGVSDGTAEAPEILADGTDQEYVIGSNNGATIYSNGISKWLVSVSVDGEIVDEKYYTVSGEDSTIITFTSEFLDTLAAGDHDVTLTFTYGEASAVLTIIEPADEPTTDEPTTDEPTTDEPTTDEPTTDEPTTDEPTTDEPTTDEPTTGEPTTDEPTTDAPATDEPTTTEPVTDPSVSESTTSDAEAGTPEGNKNPTSPSTGSARYIIGASSAVLFAAMGLAFASKKRKEDEE